MARDYIYIENNDIVVVVDNCGSVGSLEQDAVKASEEDVAYYSARSTIMELLSVYSTPIACTAGIFLPKYHECYLQGMKKSFSEVDVDIEIITSTETNFTMNQSAFSITLVGKGKIEHSLENLSFGVLGKPYVGDEVLNNEILSLTTFKEVVNDNNIKYILPVGSKGIKYEYETNINSNMGSCSLDVLKSAGPSTCIIIGYVNKEKVIEKYKDFFYEIGETNDLY